MRTVLQRVREARVRVAGEVVGEIGSGLLALVGVAPEDGADQARATAHKLRHLRVFDDGSGRMNLDVRQAEGGVLVVSQFTLAADARRGRRPSFSAAASPEHARAVILLLVAELEALGVPVAQGRFGAAMQVELVNDGPVTFLLEV
ncbi:MAG TPA: D-aminoacyl-tRNA deacylase [Thermoanaerobaculia bacterium]|nr:D-aminoacyl-tRNA deacylase [Thermoanaerobaculia bacterium]